MIGNIAPYPQIESKIDVLDPRDEFDIEPCMEMFCVARGHRLINAYAFNILLLV
jgi:hypothetical protein